MASRLAQKDLAALLGLSTRQVRNLVDAGMPVVSEGGKLWYDGPACVAWYVGEKEKAAKSDRSVEAIDEARERARKLRFEADLAELKVARERREVAPMSEWRAAADDEAARVGGVIGQMPSEFASVLAARLGVSVRQASAVLREIADGVRARLAAGDVDDQSEEEAA
jgi:phage terminase Nu1 subunit (DNA packaging protein)